MTSIRIFQIGFNRCGTKTIHDYLCANGLRGVHYANGKLAKRIFSNRERGWPMISGYESCQVFTDMEWISPDRYLEAYKLYPRLADEHPEGVFILNTRNFEDWVKSRLSHLNGQYAHWHKSYLNLQSDSDLIHHWREDWDNHHAAVIKFFSKRRNRFRVCHIDTDLPDVLNETLYDLALDRSLYSINDGQRIRYRNHFEKKGKEQPALGGNTSSVQRLRDYLVRLLVRIKSRAAAHNSRTPM